MPRLPRVLRLLDPELLDEIGSALNDSTGVVPSSPEEMIRFLLGGNEALIFNAAQWGASDTVVRDELASAVCRHFDLARSWPTFGEGIDIEAFQAELEQKARAAGWFVAEDSGAWPGYDEDWEISLEPVAADASA